MYIWLIFLKPYTIVCFNFTCFVSKLIGNKLFYSSCLLDLLFIGLLVIFLLDLNRLVSMLACILTFYCCTWSVTPCRTSN